MNILRNYMLTIASCFVACIACGGGYYEFVVEWGDRGTNIGEFVNGPSAIAVDTNDLIYVLDSGGNRIQIYMNSGEYVSEWVTRTETNNGAYFIMAEAMTLNSAGIVYVGGELGYTNSGIFVFLDNGVFVTNLVNHGVSIGQVEAPFDLLFDSMRAELIVHDMGGEKNGRIQKFDSAGSALLEFGSYGIADDQFLGIGGLAVDSSGTIYVSDLGGDVVKKFSPEGHYIATWEGGEAGFDMPSGIIADRFGNLVVSNVDDLRIFTPSGDYIGSFSHMAGLYGAFDPYLGAVDSHGNLYVVDSGNARIVKFAPTVSGWPVVSDPTSTNITATTATLGGTVTDDGGGTIIERGVYWSTLEGFSPPGEGSKVSESGEFGEGVFTVDVANLPLDTNIYFRAFARHIAAPGFAEEASFTTTTGNVIYVNSITGDDSYDGYASEVSGGTGPKATLDGAMAIAVSGDTIEMAPGEYAEIPITLNFDARNITLRSSGGVTFSE